MSGRSSSIAATSHEFMLNAKHMGKLKLTRKRHSKSSRGRKGRLRQKPANPLGFEALEDRRLLATFAVTNLNDAGMGSLRSAIRNANSNVGLDLILFDGVAEFGVISLTSGELEITDTLVIFGTGPDLLAIDAQQNSRVFNFTAPTGDFTIRDLTVTGGRTTGDNIDFDDNTYSGGGIRFGSDGLLRLQGAVVRDNSTAGIAPGGGVFTRFGSVELLDSTVSGNSTTKQGGGIFTSQGALQLRNSTVSGNDARYSGGGIWANTFNLDNSTISGNRSTGRGGGFLTFGELTMTASTVSGNVAGVGGGGVYATNFYTTTIENSIIAGNVNSAGGPNDLEIDLDRLLNIDFSLVGAWGGFANAGIGNLFGTMGTPVDPGLGPLANNGGRTETHALELGSPAIDRGRTTPPFNTFDQRDRPFARVYDDPSTTGSGIDMGAYERQQLDESHFVVNTNADVGIFTNSTVGLREAINSANGNSFAATVTFDPDMSGQTLTLDRKQIEISQSVTIDATTLAGGVTIDANEQSRIFDVTTPNAVKLAGLTLTGGHTIGDHERGGAIRAAGALIIEQSSLVANSTLGSFSDGGAVWALGDVSMMSSTVSGNSTAGLRAKGGGVFSRGRVVISNSTISGNSTAGLGSNGGGIASTEEMKIVQSTVTKNRVNGPDSRGGGLWNDGDDDTMQVHNSIVAENVGPGNTADIKVGAGLVDIQFSLIGVANGSEGPPVGAGNLFGSTSSPFDPQLQPLANNGGKTFTHALLSGSPAIDRGNDSLPVGIDGQRLVADQRGAKRTFDGDGNGAARVDIGAVEQDSPLLSTFGPFVTSVARDSLGFVDSRPDLLNTFAVTFDTDVDVGRRDLSIRNDTLGGTAVDSRRALLNYDSLTRTAQWSFRNVTLAPGFYSFELSDDIVSTSDGMSLNGDFDVTPGGDYVTPVYVALPGDANLDGQVNVLGDAFALVRNLGVSGGASWAEGDFNDDEVVDVLGDAFILVGRLGQSVVPPASTASFSAAKSSPTATSNATAAAAVKQNTVAQPISFISQQDDDHDKSSDVQRSKTSPASTTLLLAGSQNLDAAFESSDLIEVEIF